MHMKMPRVLLSLLAFASLPLFAGNVATVNGKPIPGSHLENLVKSATERGQPDTPELRASVKETLIVREVLVQEAEKRKLANQPTVKAQLAITRRNVLITALMLDYLSKHPVSDAEVQKEYDKAKTEAGEVEYHVLHILLEKEDDAKETIAKLKGGADFKEVAKEKSKDNSTAARGGDLAWGTLNSYVTPFANAVKTLKKGETTQTPVKSDYGWHIIRVEDTRAYVFPDLKDLKPRITRAIQERQWEQYASALRKQAKVK
ncbi:MAG: peptidylprolyl isomerase [Burkholderiaceae bacterium]|jgi:peptidyl-prolyl cis-trans isomerase C|nr:peptidylprolyl isomerase [Burkholderiaceae bacterium]